MRLRDVVPVAVTLLTLVAILAYMELPERLGVDYGFSLAPLSKTVNRLAEVGGFDPAVFTALGVPMLYATFMAAWLTATAILDRLTARESTVGPEPTGEPGVATWQPYKDFGGSASQPGVVERFIAMERRTQLPDDKYVSNLLKAAEGGLLPEDVLQILLGNRQPSAGFEPAKDVEATTDAGLRPSYTNRVHLDTRPPSLEGRGSVSLFEAFLSAAMKAGRLRER